MDRKIQKGKVIRILEIIGKGAKTAAEIFDALFPSQYESYREMMGLYVHDKRFKNKRDWKNYKRDLLIKEERQRFYSLLSKLKKQGFIEKPKKGFWRITKKGNSKKKQFYQPENNPLPEGRYRTDKSIELKIIVFDIPEKEKRKRNWLRAVLKRLGFKMLQKSVWIGKVKLPEEFINDLRKLRLLQFVEILAVTKTGSLRHLE